jgi:hypothetical protein
MPAYSRPGNSNKHNLDCEAGSKAPDALCILDCLGIPSKPPPIFPAVLESDTEDYIN